MFGKLLSSIIKPQAPKVMVNNNFLSAIKNVEVSREKIDNHSEYDQLINSAVDMIDRFCETNDNEELVNAINILVDATEVRQSKPDAYFYLSSIAYTINDLEMALKYLKYTVLINPNFPNLDFLRECITDSLNVREV